jgi:hypothetical protein
VQSTKTLSEYYRAVDEGRIDDAMSMLSETVRFAIVLPNGTWRGQGRAEMAAYLSGRGVPDRAHVVLRESHDDDVDFAYGKVTEGSSTTGHYLAAVRLGPDGLIASYQVTFDLEHVLLED